MVVVLDTNVLSELMKGPQGDSRVHTWVRSLREQPVTTVLNRAELLSGIAVMPAGRRRDVLVEKSGRLLLDLRVSLPFSVGCDTAYAQIVAVRTRAGRPVGAMDALIAAIAVVNGASIATKDVDGFSGIGLTVHNPWSD